MYSLNKHLLDTTLCGPMNRACDKIVNKTDLIPAFWEIFVLLSQHWTLLNAHSPTWSLQCVGRWILLCLFDSEGN